MKFSLRTSIAAVVVLSASLFCFAQAGPNGPVEERSVRAEMQFLAGDALQGRGSGTIFERIAAEYIGSQFMQFGLEPAGEVGPDGKRTFVQSVEVAGRETLTSLKFSGEAGLDPKLGKDVIVFSIFSKTISGELQKLKTSDTAKAGSIVLLMLSPDDKFDVFQTAVAKFQKDGAAAVILSETREIRDNWDSVAERKASLSRRGGNLLAVSSEFGSKLAQLADGTKIEFKGEFAAGASSYTWNAMGKIEGSDPTSSGEVILLTSHLDHLGNRENTAGDDKIFNGADDDASGSVAVVELARVLAAGKRPKRTVYFVCFGSEEAGGHGARWFVGNLPFPKEKLVANLEFEMIGRPDPLMKPDDLWLTGFERSDLGSELAKRGARLVQDPRPDQNFFMRSDNYQLAKAGIIAHTVSSFGLHTDYHKVSAEMRTIDIGHMTRAINSMVAPILWLVNSNFFPAWKEGKKP